MADGAASWQVEMRVRGLGPAESVDGEMYKYQVGM